MKYLNRKEINEHTDLTCDAENITEYFTYIQKETTA